MSEAEPQNTSAQREVSLEDALRAAQHLQRTEKLDLAEAIYNTILEALPDEPNALHFLGVLRHQQGRNDEAIDLIRRAAARLPGNAGPWLNLGNVLLEAQRYDEAVDAYQQAADYAPESISTYSNLGVLYTRRGHFELAEPCYQRALKLAPAGESRVFHNYATMLHRQQRYEESVAYGLKARDVDPGDPSARRLLSMSYALLGNLDAARGVLHEWLAADPDNPAARHMLAAMGGDDAPARASDAYIVAEFDGFSKSFDSKLEALDYRAPALVADALARAMASTTTPAFPLERVLDAGCGTGLCAPRLRPMAARLEGVDLSAGMLEKAHSRGGYDALTQAELTAFINHHRAQWDAIVSADTLCYFGDLAPVFTAAKQALRAGGWLVFSVEALDTEALPYRLNYTGRYTHSRGYLEQRLRAAGLEPVDITRAVLRLETLRPVHGWVVTARNRD